MAHSTKEGSKLKKNFDKSSCESGEVHGDNIIELADEEGRLYHIPIHSSVCCQEFDVFELEIFIKNETHYLVVLSFAHYKAGVRLKSYIFAKKTVQKIKKLFEDSKDENKNTRKDFGLIQDEDDVNIFEGPSKLKSMKMKKVLPYMIGKN
jgi:hypothetical protein